MSFIGTVKIGTNALGQLCGGEQAVGLQDGAITMDPFGFNGIKPGALLGQKRGENAHAFPRGFDLHIVLADPGAHEFALMPRGIVPDEQPGGLPLGLQCGAAPVQKLSRDGTHGTSIHEAQRHLVAEGSLSWSSLPQHTITGQGFGIGVGLAPGLFDQEKWLIRALPGMCPGQREATPPHLVQKADGPALCLTVLRGPGQQSVASGLFC